MSNLIELRDPLCREHELLDLTQSAYAVEHSRKGRNIFLLGDAGSGKKALGRALLKAVEKRPNFITATIQFWDQEKQPTADLDDLLRLDTRWSQHLAAYEQMFTEGLPKAIQLVGYPWVALLAQLVGKSKPVLDWFKANRKQIEDSPLIFPSLVRHAAPQHSFVIFLEDLQYAPSAWLDLLKEFRREVLVDLPVLLIASVETSRPLGNLREQDLNDTLEIVRDAVERSLAKDIFLYPLTQSQLQTMRWKNYPLSLSLAKRLVEWTDGNSLLVQVALDEWSKKNVIGIMPNGTLAEQPGNQEWVWGDALKMANDQLEELVDEHSPYDKEFVANILRVAALEASPFTASAVAQVLELDPDEMVDFFDEYLIETDDNPHGILQERGWAKIATSTADKSLALYAFRYLYHEHVWSKYLGPEEKAGLAFELAQAIENCYFPQTFLQARKLARLFALAGNVPEAKRYHQALKFARNIEALKLHVEVLRHIAKTETDLTRLYDAQLELGLQMYWSEPYFETIQVFQSAYKIARQLEDTAKKAWALYYRGSVLRDAGKYILAKHALENCLTLCNVNRLELLKARTLHALGTIAREQGDYATARGLYEESLALKKDLGDKRGIARTLYWLAQTAFKIQNLREAEAKAQEALVIAHEIDDQSRIAWVGILLARIEFAKGNLLEAKDQIEKVIPQLENMNLPEKQEAQEFLEQIKRRLQ